MARLNRPGASLKTHEGAPAQRVSAWEELQRAVATCLLWEPTFYERGEDIAKRISELVGRVDAKKVAALATDARERLHLRHVPLFLCVELARRGGLTKATLNSVLQRPDELAEFLAMYWRDGKCPISKQAKAGLAMAFGKFDAYQFGKWNRDGKVKLRDVMFMCHPKPGSKECEVLYKQIADNTLPTPDTWEVSLSKGKGKKETFERLLSEKKLGGMALLMNLRNMDKAQVDEKLVRERLRKGVKRALPFRFLTAAKHAPTFEPELDEGMLASMQRMPKLKGSTGIVVDVSGSMSWSTVSRKGETTSMDAACGLAILVRELCEDTVKVASFSNHFVEIPARHGMALRDAIVKSQLHGGTYLGRAVETAKSWGVERMLVLTDEQSHDRVGCGPAPKSYMINIRQYKPAVGYGNGWTHINGWSEHVLDYIVEHERIAVESD